MTTRRLFASLAGMALSLVAVGFFTAAGSTSDTHPATPNERAFCLAHLEKLGPITGDCGVVPTFGEILEDDPWGRWDCRTMGNHMCGDANGNVTIYFNLGGELHGFEVNAPDRPACIVEPSNVKGGFEVIFYPAMSMWGGEFGFEVDCPI